MRSLMTRTRAALVLLVALAFATPALAALRSLPVTEGIWAIVGKKGQRSAENLGNNATFGLIATEDGTAGDPVIAGLAPRVRRKRAESACPCGPV
jgi:hypothetical protein